MTPEWEWMSRWWFQIVAMFTIVYPDVFVVSWSNLTCACFLEPNVSGTCSVGILTLVRKSLPALKKLKAHLVGGECGNPPKRNNILLDPLLFGDVLRIVPSWIFQICKVSCLLGFCGWFLIFWHNFLHTKEDPGMVNHQFSPPFLGDYVFWTFFQASSRVANPSFVALHFQSYIDSWKIANLCQGKLPEVTYLPTLGTIIFKKYLGEAMQFCLEVRYLYPFCSLTSATWVFPVFILKVRAFRIESW